MPDTCVMTNSTVRVAASRVLPSLTEAREELEEARRAHLRGTPAASIPCLQNARESLERVFPQLAHAYAVSRAEELVDLNKAINSVHGRLAAETLADGGALPHRAEWSEYALSGILAEARKAEAFAKNMVNT